MCAVSCRNSNCDTQVQLLVPSPDDGVLSLEITMKNTCQRCVRRTHEILDGFERVRRYDDG
jgi:hypothetical protein